MSDGRSTFLEASIPELVQKLKLDEKIALLGAPNWWNTTAIPRLNVPAVRMSDGPNGVRGSSHFVSTPAQCIPCATALASTFDTELIGKVGTLLAEEAKTKSSVILLAPTCNIQRSPLGGRAFESFSEDPHLSGMMAASYVGSLQENGVAATIKHYVGNDQEHERTAADSVVSERALREIYLYPFMLAQKLAKPQAYMTSYGRIDGTHVSENKRLLTDILRKEWKFEGIIMSDWFGTYGVDASINAGMDLEMPGPPRWRTPLLINHCLSSQKLQVDTIDQRCEAILTLVQNLAKRNPEVVYGDGVERTRDSPESRALCRKVASDGIVLLKNANKVLPFTEKKIKTLAIIGHGARSALTSGGGSALLKPSYVVTPFDGVLEGAPESLKILYEIGCYAHKYLPTLENYLTTPSGEPGWACTFYTQDRDERPYKSVGNFVLRDTRVKLNDFLPAGLTPGWTIKLKGNLLIDKTCLFEFGLTVAGRAKLWIDGKLVIDNWTKQVPGDFFYGQGTREEKATVRMQGGKPALVEVEYTNTPNPDDGDRDNSQPALMLGVRLGGCEKIDAEKALAAAVQLASESDAVLYVGGLGSEWESEGTDRPTLSLPGRQDELISAIAKANKSTVVVVQCGSAISMPWVNDVSSILHGWYLGNELGNSISDVLFGKTNPSAKLPITFPVTIEDTPAYLNMRSEHGKIHYREDLYVGYKHYQARNILPLFPFGHGLSYTTFELSGLSLSNTTEQSDAFQTDVSVSVKNTGDVVGSEVVQIYVSTTAIPITTPKLQLRGFTKVHDLKPQETRKVTVSLDKYAVSYWDERREGWRVQAGRYGVHVGTSSADLSLEESFEVKKSFTWNGV